MKGKWIYKPRETSDPYPYTCSECGYHNNVRYRYCPYCGADMRGEEKTRAFIKIVNQIKDNIKNICFNAISSEKEFNKLLDELLETYNQTVENMAFNTETAYKQRDKLQEEKKSLIESLETWQSLHKFISVENVLEIIENGGKL